MRRRRRWILPAGLALGVAGWLIVLAGGLPWGGTTAGGPVMDAAAAPGGGTLSWLLRLGGIG